MKSVIRLLAFLCLLVTARTEGNVTFSGQIRQRYEMVDKDFVDSTGFVNSNYLRTRFAASYAANDVDVFIQFQDSRVFGSETSTLTDGSADALDLHQSYFRTKNLFNLPLNVKVGRFEMIYGSERLIGAVGWHNIGRSFDGVVFNYISSFANVDLFNLKEVESGAPGDEGDSEVRGVYANLFLLHGHAAHVFSIKNGERTTTGADAKGRLGPLNYELELAGQSGIGVEGLDSRAKMFSVNVGFRLGESDFLAGWDFISGDDRSTAGVDEAFSTLYATNHKFYGYMDYFVNLPVHTGGLGLNDWYVKASLTPLAGFKSMFHFHVFVADEEDATGERDFGTELDITIRHGYNDLVTFVGGYSLFIPGPLKAPERVNGTFAYLMTIVGF